MSSANLKKGARTDAKQVLLDLKCIAKGVGVQARHAPMSLALPSDFIPLSPTQPLACIYRGAVGEDHFDVGMEMSFGVCEDEYSRLHYLAVPEQLRSLVIGGAYELEVQRVDRPLIQMRCDARRPQMPHGTAQAASTARRDSPPRLRIRHIGVRRRRGGGGRPTPPPRRQFQPSARRRARSSPSAYIHRLHSELLR